MKPFQVNLNQKTAVVAILKTNRRHGSRSTVIYLKKF